MSRDALTAALYYDEDVVFGQKLWKAQREALTLDRHFFNFIFPYYFNILIIIILIIRRRHNILTFKLESNCHTRFPYVPIHVN